MSRLAAALARDFEVCLLDGGPVEPRIRLLPEIRRVQLEPLFRGGSGAIRPCDEALSVEAALSRRRRLALATIEELRPVALVVEFYPFARWFLSEEIDSVIAATRSATAGALAVSSVRDYLETGFDEGPKPEAEVEPRLVARLRSLDGLLVHADPAADLWDSRHPAIAESSISVVRTGYIGPGPERRRAESARRGTVVSVGGGVDGLPLILAVLGLWRRIDSLPFPPSVRPLTVFLGPYMPAPEIRQVEEECRTLGVRCSPYCADFCAILAASALSISRAGYNTCMDILASDVHAVLSPTRINDQLPRATCLSGLGRAAVAFDTEESIEAAIGRALSLDARRCPIALDGAPRSAEWLRRELASRGLC